MKIGSPEHEKWWKEVQLFFRWMDHYYREFNESPYLLTNKYLVYEKNAKKIVEKASKRKGKYPKIG